MPTQSKDMLMEHFMNPRNVGELPDATAVGDVGNPLCGDIIRLFLKIENDRVTKATFKTFGCRHAIATSSILTELVQGKTIDQALKISRQDIARVLGSLPPLKQNCAKLGELALQSALGDYIKRTRNDASLAEDVYERIHSPSEWSASARESLDSIDDGN